MVTRVPPVAVLVDVEVLDDRAEQGEAQASRRSGRPTAPPARAAGDRRDLVARAGLRRASSTDDAEPVGLAELERDRRGHTLPFLHPDRAGAGLADGEPHLVEHVLADAAAPRHGRRDQPRRPDVRRVGRQPERHGHVVAAAGRRSWNQPADGLPRASSTVECTVNTSSRPVIRNSFSTRSCGQTSDKLPPTSRARLSPAPARQGRSSRGTRHRRRSMTSWCWPGVEQIGDPVPEGGRGVHVDLPGDSENRVPRLITGVQREVQGAPPRKLAT